MRSNKEWRESLTEPVNKIVALLQNYKDIEINSGADIVGMVVVVKDVLFGGMDMLLDALFAYSPTLQADRERIEQEAYDDEAIAALGVVLGLAYPLDRLLTVWSGPAVMQTSTNLPYTNGKSGIKPTARQKAT